MNILWLIVFLHLLLELLYLIAAWMFKQAEQNLLQLKKWTSLSPEILMFKLLYLFYAILIS
jgi:hypothetical protein